MIWKDLANALAHNSLSVYCHEIKICCERCKNSHMMIISYKENLPENIHQDIVITREFYLRCPECGFEEGDMTTTIIPSWIWHPIRDDPNVEWRNECVLLSEKSLAKDWDKEDEDWEYL